MESKKSQHTIPRSYLKAWRDPTTPDGAFIWVLPRAGGAGRHSSLRSTFTEEDFYTLPAANEARDLSIENALGIIEGAFVGVRDGALRERRTLDEPELASLCAFVAAMLTRTTRFTEMSKEHWSDALRRMEDLENAPPEVKARWAGASSGRSMGTAEVRAKAEFTAQINVGQTVIGLPSFLSTMNLTVMETDSTPGFITSDAPCVLFDPVAQLMPAPYNGHGLASPTIEVTMPISSQQMMLLSWRFERGYRPVTDDAVREANRLTRAHSHRSFVVSRDVTHPEWFESIPKILRGS